MPPPIGFWSYVHDDDAAEHGRIVALAHDIVAEMGLQTGEDIELFVDRDALAWGTMWQTAIDEGLGRVAFFIPVLTPRYFSSVQCRLELQTFARRATSLGIKELVMPLLYIGVGALNEEPPADDLVALVKTFQWQSWAELRLTDRESSAYRTAVRGLANRLVEANRATETSASQTVIDSELRAESLRQPTRSGPARAPVGDDEPGTMDLLAQTELAMPDLLAAANAMGSALGGLGPMFTRATEDMTRSDSQGRGFVGRLRVTRMLANELEPLAEDFHDQCNAFTTQLHVADPGIRVLIGLLASGAGDEQQPAVACDYFSSVRTLDEHVGAAVRSAESMMREAQLIEAMSRDLRPGLRRLRAAVTVLREGRATIGDWTALIDRAGLDVKPLQFRGTQHA